MKDERRAKREGEIMAVAYELLEALGPSGISMLAVAKAAKASNETLYKWYGDKLGLFRAMAERNGAEIRALLEQAAAAEDASALEVLDTIGPLLLGLLTERRAVALARAAAADATGALGEAHDAASYGAIDAVIGQICRKALESGALRGGDAETIRDTYLALLLGDWQIRRGIHGIPAPKPVEIRARADRALMLTWRLFGRERGNS